MKFSSYVRNFLVFICYLIQLLLTLLELSFYLKKIKIVNLQLNNVNMFFQWKNGAYNGV